MTRKLIRARETRYEYAGNDLNSWFTEVPLKYEGHDAIWSLGCGSDGRIYIGMAGEHNLGTAALVAYDPKTRKTRMVCNLGKFLGEPKLNGRMPHSKIHFSICPAGRYIWFATHVSGAYGKADTRDPVGRGPIADTVSGYEGGRLLRYDIKDEKVEQFGIVVPNEGVRSLHLDKAAAFGYGICYPKHRLFMRNLLTGETYVSGRMGRYGGIDVFVAPDGKVWGAHDGYEGTEAGQLYYFDPAVRRIVDVNAFLPRSSVRPMCFPNYGNHVLHMLESPDGGARISAYGESRISYLDPTGPTVYDWGSVWEKPLFQGKRAEDSLAAQKVAHDASVRRPDFAWSPQYDRKGRSVAGRKYDRLVWYGEERWEYQTDVKLCAVLYNHDKPDEIVKVRFGTPKIGMGPAGHWAASTVGADGRIYFANRVRNPHHRHYMGLRLTIFTPPKTLGDLKPAEGGD